jgi:hypothetical protein
LLTFYTPGKGEIFFKRGFAPLPHPVFGFIGGGIDPSLVSLYERERLTFAPLKKGD